MSDPVNHPDHYNSHPSGVECITITEHMNFCIGNAIKYAWRAGLKTESPIQDLEKAIWYLQREVDRLRSEQTTKRIEEAQPIERCVMGDIPPCVHRPNMEPNPTTRARI